MNLVVQVGQNSPRYKISNHSNISFDKENIKPKKKKKKNHDPLHTHDENLTILSVCLDPRLRFEPTYAFCVFVLFFFFFHAFWRNAVTVH